MRLTTPTLPLILTLSLAACVSGGGETSGFDRMDAARLGNAPSAMTGGGGYGAAIYKPSANETVTVRRTGSNTTVRTYEYGGNSTHGSAYTPRHDGQVPVFSAISKSSARTGVPVSGKRAVNEAARIKAEPLNGIPNGVPVDDGRYKAVLRRVDLDGESYAVFERLEYPSVWRPMLIDMPASLARIAAAETGCSVAGRANEGRYADRMLAEAYVVPLSC